MKIAVIGAGLMGAPMAGRLLDAGHEVHIYNRTASKVEGLQQKGAVIEPTATDAVLKVQCAILMLSDYAVIQKTLLTQDKIDWEGRTFIQMGTIASQESLALKEVVESCHGHYLECPVLGSRPEAAKGQLVLFVGSTPEQFSQWKDLLKCFGPSPEYIGEVGTAAVLKLAFNQIIVSLIITFSTSLGLIQKSGIDVDKFMSILKSSSLYAPSFGKKLPRLVSRDFSNPNFPVKHLLKDVDLIIHELQAQDICVAQLDDIRTLVLKALEAGFQEEDYSSLYKVINP